MLSMMTNGKKSENNGAIGFASGKLMWIHILKVDLLIWERSCLV